ncbi:MAG: hypothetical protein ACR2H1_15250 [Limisphaerales bacterium]
MKPKKIHLAAVALISLVALLGYPSHAVTLIDTNLNDGSFNAISDQGSIGGSPLGGDTIARLGAGPWNGRAVGSLGVVAQPTVAVTPAQNGSISGLTSVAGLQNKGSLFQTLTGTSFQTNTFYTLSGNLTTVGLDVVALANSGVVGVAISAGGTQGIAPTPGTDVATSTNAPSPLTLTLLSSSSNSANFTFGFVTGAAPAGDVGVRLFGGERIGVVIASFSTVTFDNIKLTGERFTLVSSPIVTGPYLDDNNATFTQIGTASSPNLVITKIQVVGGNVLIDFLGASATYRATTPVNGSIRFFQLKRTY